MASSNDRNYWLASSSHHPASITAGVHALLTAAIETAIFCATAYVAGFCFTRGTLRAHGTA